MAKAVLLLTICCKCRYLLYVVSVVIYYMLLVSLFTICCKCRYLLYVVGVVLYYML